MGRIATKKTVDNSLGYEFGDVIERRAFGRFEIIKTKRGMMYKNYTGYHVWTTPYAVGVGGKAHEKTLYAWLNNLLDFAIKSEGKIKEAYNGDDDTVTYGDILDSMKIVTEAVMTLPMTAFSDEKKAMEFAGDYIKWLAEQQTLLERTMRAAAPGEDVKTETEELERAVIMDEAAGLIHGETDEGMKVEQ